MKKTIFTAVAIAALSLFAYSSSAEAGVRPHNGNCKVPEPATMLLLGSALSGAVASRKLFKKD